MDSPAAVGRTIAAPFQNPVPAVDREHEVIARGRDQDVLNGVFTLTLYNRRHTGPIHPGQEPIDVHAALGDLHDRAALDDAVRRTEALLTQATDLVCGTQDARDDQTILPLARPGFTPEQLSAALNWGYCNGR